MQAQAALNIAQAKLDQLKNPPAADVAAAQANAASADAALAQLKLPSQNDLTMAKSDFDKAQAELNTAQAAFDRIGGNTNPFIAMTPQSQALQQAYDDFKKAQAAYNAKISPTDSQLKQALAAVAQAQDQLTGSSPRIRTTSGALRRPSTRRRPPRTWPSRTWSTLKSSRRSTERSFGSVPTSANRWRRACRR